ncbi:MAG: hypothetical protein QY309_02995 [Cyclobacteriaceae bacterium]|nr:MAG: hypothetical protein QY309_02995 [Cyclobacteriaceae bacterium]
MTEKITLTGIARNGKGGALLQTTDGVFYIDGLSAWNEGLLNQQVEVTGSVEMEKVDEQDLISDAGEWRAGFSGEKKTLVGAMWKLVED